MPSLSDLLLQLLDRVLDTLEHTWPYLVLSIVLASAIQVYVGTTGWAGGCAAAARSRCSARWPSAP